MGTERREGRRGPRSCRSRRSQFMILKGSVHNKSNREMRKTAKVCVFCFSSFASFALFAVHVFYLDCSLSFSPQKILWSVSPCSYPSCRSRFMKFKGSVRCNTNRERRENREQKRECPLKIFHEERDLPFPPKKGVSVVIFTAKCTNFTKVCIGLLLHVRVVRVVRGSRF